MQKGGGGGGEGGGGVAEHFESHAYHSVAISTTKKYVIDQFATNSEFTST